ncbi:MAG: FHA domain-containing protein [Gemmataceae bacterium]
MPARLVALNDGPDIWVDKPILLLGRHPECDVQIDSRKISRRHCCIAQVNDYLVIRDLDSTNGIRINGARVLEGKLQAGDEVTIGNFNYRVSWGDDAGQPSTASARARPPAPFDDAALESCDEPIALPEPNRRPAPPPAADSFVLPDNLKLMPSSGSFPQIRRDSP